MEPTSPLIQNIFNAKSSKDGDITNQLSSFIEYKIKEADKKEIIYFFENNGFQCTTNDNRDVFCYFEILKYRNYWKFVEHIDSAGSIVSVKKFIKI